MDKSTDKFVQSEILASPVSFVESPRKCNLSFSINFDFNDVDNENSTDSENADLQIDISEVDNYEPSSKHKRETVDEASVLNEMEEEIERQLDAEAAKTNLTATNVKNILKHVIPYEHLMTMIQKWLQDAESDVNFGLKLTRAKARKLAAAHIPWPITTTQNASSEVQALIQEELPEDSSDEEYNPEHDKHSDDDREAENITNSDVESQTMMIMNNKDVTSSKQQTLSQIQYDPEGIFKIPAIPHVSTEEESIGQRTRSKFSLSETSLQEIEQAFIPPDITADMIEDWDCELDEDWDNFLKEFTRPLTQDPTVEDDPEADPEYNILEDETDLLDKEELRTDKAVEVPRKEQYDLIAELLELTPMFLTQEQEISRKKKPSDNITPSIENNTMNCSMVDLLPVLAEPELPKLVNPEQRFLLRIQFQQHVQLMAQHFAMTYMHPEYHSLAKTCKQNLNSLRYLSNGPNSAFNAENLEEALKLVSTWESKFSDSKFHLNFQKTMTDEIVKVKMCRMNKWRHTEQFFPELEELLVESKALMYPQLLPQMPFRSGLKKHVKSPYLRSEENLIALGIEQFLPFVASRPSKFKTKKMQLIDASQLISYYLLPCRDAQGILCHIKKCRAARDGNPVKHYFEKGCAPKIIHYITLENKLKAPKDQPFELLPVRWQMYLNIYNQKKDRNKLAKSVYLFPHRHSNFGKRDIYMNATRKSYLNISNNHPLRNPVVNILPKILPATLNPKASTTNKINSSAKGIPKFNDDNNDTKLSDNNAQITEGHVEKDKTHKSVLDPLETNIVDMKAMQADKASDKNNIILNSILATSSMVPKNPSQKSTGLPQIRRTTPRLAKTRSAQNMKLMAQALGSKNSSNCNTLKSKEKNVDKTVGGRSSAPKVDNEEEIAELMLASTTITKDCMSRKKAKQTRELEIIKRLLKAENPFTEEEREAKFAASYLQKLHVILEPSNPELFKAVMKLFLDYNEKLESMNQTITDTPFSEEFLVDKETLQDNTVKKDLLTVKLYEDVCKRLQSYPEMCTDLLLFLRPHQAAMIGKSVEYIMLQKMNEFVHVAQIYFAKQPSRIAKMMQAIMQLSSDPHATLENVYTVMSPVFKGHPIVMDLFLQILPTVKPPESLFAPHMFENLTCPLGPYDKNITYAENATELYENIELPIRGYQEDPYGGDNCKCVCHNTDDPNLKNNSDHCVSCGTRFLNGRIYLQTSEGLRPAKITFPGEDQEKLENIARVSLKIVDKVVPTPISPKKRRKSSKNDSSHDDVCQKQCTTKYSPVKDNEDIEKSKSKGGVKFALKTDKKKVLKRVGTVNHVIENKKIRISQCKNKREKKAEENDALLEDKEFEIMKQEKVNAFVGTESSDCIQLPQDGSLGTEIIVEDIPGTSSNIDKSNVDPVAVAEDNVLLKSNITDNKPWTRQEDMVLLQHIKKEYSENSFQLISGKLENRTVHQVKQRCQTLLSLLQKMM